MRFHWIKLKRFRSFLEPAVKFTVPGPGLVHLTGKNLVEPELEANGVGKSSLFEGIYWTLFGKTSRKLKAGDVANWQHPQGCMGLLKLEDHGKEYLIKRTWKPNTLTVNGKEVDQPSLEKELHVSPETFTHSCFFPQGKESFLDLRPEQKMELLVNILKLELWDSASEFASEEARGLEEEAIRKEGRLSEIVASLENLDATELAKKEREWEEQHSDDMLKLVEQLPKIKLSLDKKSHDKLLEERADCNATIRSAQSNLRDLGSFAGGKCPTCGSKLDKEHYKKEIAKWNSVRKEAEEKLEAVVRKLNKAEEAKRQLDWAEVTRHKLARMKTEVNPYTEQRRKMTAQRFKAQLKLGKLKQELNLHRKEGEVTKFWIKGFKEVRLLVVKAVIAQLEAEVNQTIHELGLENWSIKFDVEREKKGGGISRGFTTMILSPRNEVPVPWESWSGGESQRLRLAGMMGFANLINNMTGHNPNLEMWDEPSNWMSGKGIHQMLEALEERAENFKRCIIIADHRALGYGGFSGTIHIVKGKEGSTLA